VRAYYTYLWLREDGTPYYVGKGSRKRAYSHYEHCVHPPTDKSRVIIEYHASEEDAFLAERFLILYFGRRDLGTGNLLNRTSGGEGAVGAKWTEEQKSRFKNRYSPPPIRKGCKLSEESRKKMSLARMGHPVPQSVRDKISEAQKGKRKPVWSAESRAKLSATITGRKISAETRLKLTLARQARLHVPISEETRRRMSESARNRMRANIPAR